MISRIDEYTRLEEAPEQPDPKDLEPGVLYLVTEWDYLTSMCPCGCGFPYPSTS